MLKKLTGNSFSFPCLCTAYTFVNFNIIQPTLAGESTWIIHFCCSEDCFMLKLNIMKKMPAAHLLWPWTMMFITFPMFHLRFLVMHLCTVYVFELYGSVHTLWVHPIKILIFSVQIVGENVSFFQLSASDERILKLFSEEGIKWIKIKGGPTGGVRRFSLKKLKENWVNFFVRLVYYSPWLRDGTERCAHNKIIISKSRVVGNSAHCKNVQLLVVK